jgi:hypothetical protein
MWGVWITFTPRDRPERQQEPNSELMAGGQVWVLGVLGNGMGMGTMGKIGKNGNGNGNGGWGMGMGMGVTPGVVLLVLGVFLLG